MQLIELETEIAAPIERCFLLSLSIDLHVESAGSTGERAIAGVTRGIIGPNQTVTWRGRHFGLMLDHTSLIDRYEPPRYFRDVMIRGHFHSFEHEHIFEHVEENRTLMRDCLKVSAPFGVVGFLAEHFFLRRYFIEFLQARNAAIRRVAEGPTEEWRRYLG